MLCNIYIYICVFLIIVDQAWLLERPLGETFLPVFLLLVVLVLILAALLLPIVPAAWRCGGSVWWICSKPKGIHQKWLVPLLRMGFSLNNHWHYWLILVDMGYHIGFSLKNHMGYHWFIVVKWPFTWWYAIHEGFHSHGGTPKWLVDFMENPNLKLGWF